MSNEWELFLASVSCHFTQAENAGVMLKKQSDMFKSFLLILFLALCSCDTAKSDKTCLMFRANFDPRNIEKVEQNLDTYAKKHGLSVFRKDKKQMTSLTEGIDAFFTTLNFDNKPIFVVTNVGSGTRLHISVMDYGAIPIAELEAMSKEFLQDLGKESLVQGLAVYVEPDAT